mmetsp:Transcript_79290/g.157020  ORF Transcript_79290/g.157020 Transcript_79290/m.157020 type:complete len:598 (-) Transcript_79290:52-1845(-)
MGYFVQIANDAGSPVFQAAQNYPDVSFASSTLFHALVTASLEHGFVPSVLRSQDAVIALAVYGPVGSRISIAMVTSEFATGQTRDLQEELHWRLSIVYRGALLIAGGELLRRQPIETLRRLLAQRLSPIVDGVMAEESMHRNCGRVPRIGLACSGIAVEWLARSVVADVALEKIVAGLPAKVSAAADPVCQARLNSSRVAAVVSWNGRVLAASRAWQQLDAVDRALLLTLSDQVGPGTFESPMRSLSLEELEELWLPSAGAGSVHSTGSAGASEATSLRPCGVVLDQPSFSEFSSCRPAKKYRMVSVRLYPQPDQIEADSVDGMPAFCLSCCEFLQRGSFKVEPAGSIPVASKAQKDPPTALDVQPLPSEAANFHIEEMSLVLSLLEEEGPSKEGITATHLQTSADNCSDMLHAVWQHLRNCKRGESLLQCTAGHLAAVALVNELTEDVVTVPSPPHTCSALPWQCRGRQRKAAATRRLIYWIHALPRLGPHRTQQYACCESFAVGGLRREDGVHCWGIMDMDLDPEWHLGPLGTEKLDDTQRKGSVGDGNTCQSEASTGQRVLSAVAEFSQQLPDKSSDLWTALGGLEAEAAAVAA